MGYVYWTYYLDKKNWFLGMSGQKVSLKMTLSWSLIITLITGIPNTFMFRLNMCLKITLCCSLIITLITMILDTFMFRLNMFLKIALVFRTSSLPTEWWRWQPDLQWNQKLAPSSWRPPSWWPGWPKHSWSGWGPQWSQRRIHCIHLDSQPCHCQVNIKTIKIGHITTLQ